MTLLLSTPYPDLRGDLDYFLSMQESQPVDRPDHSAQKWDQRADAWEQEGPKAQKGDARVRSTMAYLEERGLLRPEYEIADIGCGPARFAAAFASRVRWVTGFDLSPRMVHYGSEYARKQGVENLTLRVADFQTLDVQEEGLEKAFDLVEVFAKPKVAFLPTGSELIPLGATVKRGCNIDSNSILAHNLLREMGAEPLCYPIVPDRPENVAAALDRALEEADVVLLNGGSSKGEEDFNARLLEERGSALFHWVAAAPGKPMCVALIGNKPVINLPGPPLAVLYGMDWCIRAIVHRLLHTPLPRRQTVPATLTEPIQAPSDMEILCMMELWHTPSGYQAKQKPWRGGSVADALGAGAIFITELGRGSYQPGETLEVTLLRGLEDF